MSKAKVSPILKRAVSTPHMSGLDDQDTEGLSPSALDKRRNKLGYQRISIACGHCRRRKIRCVIADQDEMGRCQNCIRLKKECVFYPVDAVGGSESRAQQKPGSGSKSSSVISNSPSDRKHSGMTDGEREFPRFPPLASNAPSDLTSVSSGSGLGISNGTAMTTPEYGYDSRDSWHSGMFHHAESVPSDGSAAPSWRVQDSPRAGEFPAFPTSDGPPGGLYSGYHYPPPREYGMQPPMRSISYGNIEPSIGQFHSPSTTNGMEYNRSSPASHFAIAPLSSNHAPSTTSMLDPAITPVASESMQYGMYSPQWQYQQNPHPVSMEYPRHDSVGLQWYPPHLAHGVEEQGRPLQPQWHQQQHHNLMPPPGSGYSKSHSPG